MAWEICWMGERKIPLIRPLKTCLYIYVTWPKYLFMYISKEEILKKLQAIKPSLQEKYNLTELALFGSYARNEQTEKSDIDIMVDYKPKTYKGFLYTIDEIGKLFPGIEIQAAIKSGIKPQYFEVIKQDLVYA